MTTSAFEPRKYQIELIEKIKQGNSILYLPTGSGKTFIALEIIKHMQADLQKPINRGGKRTVFLVHTVALVEQHYAFIRKHSSFKVTMLTGGLTKDLKDPAYWLQIENDSQVLIMTAQIYVNVLSRGFLFLKNANLIIFDECHHAVNKHPMIEVIERFQECEENNHPKILGLTATLFNSNTTVSNIYNDLSALQKTFRSKIITSTRITEVKKYSTKAEEKFELFAVYKCPKVLFDRVTTLIEEHSEILRKLKMKDTDTDTLINSCVLLNDLGDKRTKLLINCLKDLKVHFEEFGVYFCYIGCSLYINELEKKKIEKNNEESYGDALLLMISLLKVIRKLLYKEIQKFGDVNKILTVVHNCAQKLTYLLKQLENLRVTDKCIVFVKRRMTAKILHKIIEIFFNETRTELVVDFITGSSMHSLRTFREPDFSKTSNNADKMDKFRHGKTNILIASNVLEEGVDLPDCNMIFMYDFPQTFKSYVQSKGRARKEESNYVMLVDRDHDDCETKMKKFKLFEETLENIIQAYDVSCEVEEEIQNFDDEIYTTSAGAILSKTQAISIINAYCSTLRNDNFTNTTPYYLKQQIGDQRWICKLQLPTSSAIKNIIEGPVCNSIKEAKHAVAFKTVKILHQMNVLNHNFMPNWATLQIEDEKFWLPHWEGNKGSNYSTRLQRREVDIKIPKYLEDCRPKAGETCYLHVININAEYPVPEVRRRKICDKLLTSPHEYGIITRHKIPKICDFPVFTDLGKVRIFVDTNHTRFKLNEEEINAISRFHRILFLKAMQIVQNFLYFKDDGYFLVPLKPNKKNYMEIHWNVIYERSEISDIFRPSDEQRLKYQFIEKKYFGRVVVPWYRQFPKKIQYYVITDVNDDLGLESKFPNDKYESYSDYYETVHDLKSLRPEQPLMEARRIPLNLDNLRPRSITSEKSEKQKAKECSLYLTPEFCLKMNFPSWYWYKSTILPTVLHRLHYLLLAEEIREKIVVEANIGKLHWDKRKHDVIEISEKYDLKRSQTTQNSLVSEKKKEDELKDSEMKLRTASFEKPTRKTEYHLVTSSISDEFLINYEEPPSLKTLQELRHRNGPRQKEIFEALTPAGCDDILDLERLETLGDSFLKFAVSFTLFVKRSDYNEGYLTILKSELVGNRNLFYCGNKINLGSYIKTNTFSAHGNWCPPGFGLPEELKSELRQSTCPSALFNLNIPFSEQYSGVISSDTIQNMKKDMLRFVENETTLQKIERKNNTALAFLKKQYISDKTIADSIEALIGVYVKSGILPAYRLLNYFGILANTKYEEIIGTRVPSPKNPKSNLTHEDLVPNYRKLEELLSYEFHDKSYIVEALSHPSYLKNNLTDNYQKLEFIGDAVLDFLITSYIFEYCGDLPPGKLTDLRASLVNNITFGALAVRMGFHKFLLSNNKELLESINKFINYQETQNYEIHGNEFMTAIENSDHKFAEEIECPKVLGDLFESISGAIFLDSGNNLQTVWRVYHNIMKTEIEKFSKNIPINPIRALFEEYGSDAKFIKETPISRKFKDNKVTILLCVTRDKNEYCYFGRGEKVDLCKRAAAKLALRDCGRTEFVI